MEFDRKDIIMNKLVATSLEGKFHVYDLRTQHPTKGFASVAEKVKSFHQSTLIFQFWMDWVAVYSVAGSSSESVDLLVSPPQQQSKHFKPIIGCHRSW